MTVPFVESALEDVPWEADEEIGELMEDATLAADELPATGTEEAADAEEREEDASDVETEEPEADEDTVSATDDADTEDEEGSEYTEEPEPDVTCACQSCDECGGSQASTAMSPTRSRPGRRTRRRRVGIVMEDRSVFTVCGADASRRDLPRLPQPSRRRWRDRFAPEWRGNVASKACRRAERRTAMPSRMKTRWPVAADCC